MDEGLVQDDGLFMDDLGAWCEDKYRLVGLYVRLFATGMKFKWEERIYIDLYAGAGIGRIRNTGKLVMQSPLIALHASDPFDLYIFCESDGSKLEALENRVRRIVPARKVEYIAGDSNAAADRICSLIPRASPGHKVLSLCFVDPWDIGIKFSTIRQLSARFVDFLVLLAVYMDAQRARDQYLKPGNRKVDEFLGLSSWRELWERQERTVKFPDFLARLYSQQMTTLGYIDQPLHRMKKVRNEEKNSPLYRLALFSRNKRAYDFWDQVLKYSTDQPDLF
jgi:three-Cys-motif partner protein